MLYFHHPLKTESPIMSKVLLFVPTNSQLRHRSKLDHLSPKVVLITNMLRRKNGATLYIYYEQMTSLLFLVQTSCTSVNYQTLLLMSILSTLGIPSSSGLKDHRSWAIGQLSSFVFS